MSVRVFHVTNLDGLQGIKEKNCILATGKGVRDSSTRRAYIYHEEPNWVACDIVGDPDSAKVVLELEIPDDVVLHEDDTEGLEEGYTYSDIYGKASYSGTDIPCIVLRYYRAPTFDLLS